MSDRRFFSDLPKHAKVLVQAAVFGVGFSSAVGCGPIIGDAPTCGPCCHDPGARCGPGGEQVQTVEERAQQLEEERRLEEQRRAQELEAQRQLEEDRRRREEAAEGQGEGQGEGEGDAGDEPSIDLAPPDLRRAPTCGPCCHGDNGPECGGGARTGPAISDD